MQRGALFIAKKRPLYPLTHISNIPLGGTPILWRGLARQEEERNSYRPNQLHDRKDSYFLCDKTCIYWFFLRILQAKIVSTVIYQQLI